MCKTQILGTRIKDQNKLLRALVKTKILLRFKWTQLIIYKEQDRRTQAMTRQVETLD